jgi:hypothetical protein
MDTPLFEVLKSEISVLSLRPGDILVIMSDRIIAFDDSAYESLPENISIWFMPYETKLAVLRRGSQIEPHEDELR